MRESVPSEFTKGESLEWKKSFSCYPADEWTLVYSFRGAGAGFDVTAEADGTDFLVEATTAQTGAMTAGRYHYQAFVTKDGEKIMVDSGEVKVLATLSGSNVSTVYDGRSQVKITLDAIDALLAGKATLDQQEYTIGNRQLRRYSIPDLLKLRETYQRLYNQELRAARRKKGGSYFQTVRSKFRNPS